MSAPTAHDDILSLPAYKLGKRGLENIAEPIRLANNESSFGASPSALKAFHEAAALHRYPDASQQQLREAIANVHGLDVDKILCDAGSAEILGMAIRAFIRPGDELLLSENYFMMCRIYGKTQGAQLVLAPERDFHMDVDALLARVSDKTRVVIISNPNNPTGTYMPSSEMRRLHAGLPKHVLLVLDAAYAEYACDEDYDIGMELVEQAENVIVTRTFSKIYGLGGLRAGWAYCPPGVMEVFQRIRNPYSINGPAQAAAAAVQDVEFVEMVRRHNAHWLKKIRAELTEAGIKVLPSATNFYLLLFDATPGKDVAGAAACLEAHGVIPRPVKVAGYGEGLRITVGLESENEIVLQALKSYMS